jgi:glycosyltransferase involved in cell wall biosynthesis
MNNKISIIMPVKDTAQYVGATIESILKQSYTNWELIAVNDDSSDRSLEVMERYILDERIHAISNPDPGLLKALRYGYSLTTGNLIHRMDSDDLMPENKLQSMIDAWNQHGEGSVITGGAQYFCDEGEVGDGFKRYAAWLTTVSTENTHAKNIYKESVIASNCWLVHRNDFNAIGGFEPDTFPEDYDLCFRFYTGGLNIVGLKDILHLWRDRPDRISRNWDVYKDNRFFDLKVHYYFQFERDTNRPLVLWGAGKNGKDLAKLILKHQPSLHWVCDNENKIGKDIYGVRMEHFDRIQDLVNPQIIIAVAGPDDQHEIASILTTSNYVFFS